LGGIMELEKLALKKLEDRGVKVNDIAEITLFLQEKYIPGLNIEECKNAVLQVLSKRETINAVLTGIAIDEVAEKGLIDKEICNLITKDDGLYGIDEILALSIVNVHGSIALTNFGYADKIKPGIVKVVDNMGKEGTRCTTFLDDIVSAIAASAASRLAHYGIEEYK
jgi:phosphatidylglycerophosphatase A